MPRCEGLPDTGKCPNNVNDSTVIFSHCDLFLCKSCEAARFPELYDRKPPKAEQVMKAAVSTASTSANDHIVTSSAVTASSVVATPTTVLTSRAAATTEPCDEDSQEGINKSGDQAAVTNELLCFVCTKMNNYSIQSIKTTVMEFYREDEIVLAKNVIMQVTEQVKSFVNLQQFLKPRKGTHKIRSIVDDIIGILIAIDEAGLQSKLPSFNAGNLARIPTLPEELSDVCSIRRELQMMSDQIQAHIHSSKPSISRLTAIEAKIQTLTEQIAKVLTEIVSLRHYPVIKSDFASSASMSTVVPPRSCACGTTECCSSYRMSTSIQPGTITTSGPRSAAVPALQSGMSTSFQLDAAVRSGLRPSAMFDSQSVTSASFLPSTIGMPGQQSSTIPGHQPRSSTLLQSGAVVMSGLQSSAVPGHQSGMSTTVQSSAIAMSGLGSSSMPGHQLGTSTSIQPCTAVMSALRSSAVPGHHLGTSTSIQPGAIAMSGPRSSVASEHHSETSTLIQPGASTSVRSGAVVVSGLQSSAAPGHQLGMLTSTQPEATLPSGLRWSAMSEHQSETSTLVRSGAVEMSGLRSSTGFEQQSGTSTLNWPGAVVVSGWQSSTMPGHQPGMSTRPGAAAMNDLQSYAASEHKSSTSVLIRPGVDDTSSASSLQQLMSGYSDAVKSNPPNDPDGDGFNMVKGHKAKKKPIVGGRTVNTTFQGVVKKTLICVNRLDPQTTVETVPRFLETNDIHVFSCVIAKSKMSSSGQTDTRMRKFISMCVCISQLDLDKVFLADIWPAGVTVRPWTFKQRVNSNV